MSTYQILHWYGIPTQVRARQGRTRVSVPLSDRFMETVDKVAMAAQITGGDSYIEGFVWSDPIEREGTPEEVAAAVAAEIEAEYETIAWRDTARRLKQETRNQ